VYILTLSFSRGTNFSFFRVKVLKKCMFSAEVFIGVSQRNSMEAYLSILLLGLSLLSASENFCPTNKHPFTAFRSGRREQSQPSKHEPSLHQGIRDSRVLPHI